MGLVDLNMATALGWANQLGAPPQLPPSLEPVDRRAELVDAIDEPLVRDSDLHVLDRAEKESRLDDISRTSRIYVTDVGDDGDRINIALRLWSGCMSAAETIAHEVKSGLNTPEKRSQVFGTIIDPMSELDQIYRAGVEAAPSFKNLRNEPYSFEGVPTSSPVRSFASSRET
ncbi:MAG: hypothetical protein ACE5IB_07850 [Candidatus Geothermarchaeales archaeon]